MDELTARAILVLHNSKQFDTFDIAVLLTVPEHQVARVIQASRDIVREWHAQLTVNAPQPPAGAA